MRNDIDVAFESMNETFKLATDEGHFMGAKVQPSSFGIIYSFIMWLCDDTTKAFGKKLKIEVNEIKIDALMEWQGDILEEGPYQASCDGYNLDIDIISEEPIERKKQLLKAAINGCFIEASLNLA